MRALKTLTVTLFVMAATTMAASNTAADVYTSETIDGPSSAIKSVGDVGVGTDGTGALTYIKEIDGADHVYAAVLKNGRWSGGERIDNGIASSATQVVISSAKNGYAAAAFISGGSVYGVVRAAEASSWGAPQLIYAPADPSTQPATNLNIDVGHNAHSYITFTAQGSSSDVRAAHYLSGSWVLLPNALDIVATNNAGDGVDKRPRIAVSGDGNAAVVWSETNGGNDRIYYRRLIISPANGSVSPSQNPLEVSLGSLEGRAGGAADMPDVDIASESSFTYIVFRQRFDDGGVQRARTIYRLVRASQLDPEGTIDTLGFPTVDESQQPRIDVNGREFGMFASSVGGSNITAAGTVLTRKLEKVERIDSEGSATASSPLVAVGDSNVNCGVVAWQRSPGGGAAPVIRGRFYDRTKYESEQQLSNSALGPVDISRGFDLHSDTACNTVALFTQGDDAARRVVVAGYDKKPRLPSLSTTQKFQDTDDPKITWRLRKDAWDDLTYKVLLNGKEIGTSTTGSYIHDEPIKDGVHNLRIKAVDIRGQSQTSKTRKLKIDSNAPDGSFRLSGSRKRGKRLKLRIKASDGSRKKASGLSKFTVSFGDKTKRRSFKPGATVTHTYRRKGKFTVDVRISDKAGNTLWLFRKITVK